MEQEAEDQHLDAEGIWEAARKLHEQIYNDVQNPGDAVAIVGVVLTNMLIAGRIAGVQESFIDHVLKTIKEDIEEGTKRAQSESLN